MAEENVDFDAVADVRLRMSYNDGALFSAEYLADIVRRSNAANATIALNEVVRYLVRSMRSEGAWELLRLTPPMLVPSWMNPEVVGSSEPNVPRVMDLLFPSSEGEKPRRERPANFFQWQAQLTTRALESVKPTRFAARLAWLGRCHEDPLWAEAALALSDIATIYERRSHNPRLADQWGRDPLSSRIARALMGEVKCRHSGIVAHCRNCSNGMLGGHSGWRQVMQKRNPTGGSEEDCECCRRAHDWRNTRTPKCLYCAEASLQAVEEVRSRRWGGWYWLRHELLNDAWPNNYRARAAAHHVTSRKIGYEPFSDDIDLYTGRRQIGVFVVPVPWLEDDSKQRLLDRASGVIDAMWELAGATHARSTGTSPKRSIDLARRQDWLWANRVVNMKIGEIADSRELNPNTVDERNIRRGIRSAIEELQD